MKVEENRPALKTSQFVAVNGDGYYEGGVFEDVTLLGLIWEIFVAVVTPSHLSN